MRWQLERLAWAAAVTALALFILPLFLTFLVMAWQVFFAVLNGPPPA